MIKAKIVDGQLILFDAENQQLPVKVDTFNALGAKHKDSVLGLHIKIDEWIEGDDPEAQLEDLKGRVLEAKRTFERVAHASQVDIHGWTNCAANMYRALNGEPPA